MNILIVDPKAVLPVLKYGGTERVIWDLGIALKKRGCNISYLVGKGSVCDFGKIIEYNSSISINEQIPENIDVVHFNSYCEEVEKPYIFTLHGNTKLGDTLPKNTVFISKKHASFYKSDVYVYNGLNWNNYKVNLSRERDSYHFLGKASWKLKNVNGAIDTAIKAKESLHILGGEKWNFRNLKSNFINKMSSKIKYHGIVDNAYKVDVMTRSKGMIFPVLWSEPFGLAIIESLYCGAPVFGTPYGALDELILPEVGFTSPKMEDIIYKMKNEKYSISKCNEYAGDLFNSNVMAKNYISLYEKVIENKDLHIKNPVNVLEENNFRYS